MVENRELKENSEKGLDSNDSRKKKREKFIPYLKAVGIILIGYFIINYLLDRLSLLEFFGFATGCIIGLLLLFVILELKDRQNTMTVQPTKT